MNDLIIVGGGPAGVAAGVYAARKQLKTVLIAEEFGGQSTVSDGIENWIGTVKISGTDLAKSLKAHVDAYQGEFVVIHEGLRVEKIEKIEGIYRATTNKGETFDARAVLIASGAARRKLTVPGADTFENKGLTYCASCDGPLFSGADVAVVGGGNAGFESALQLLAYAKSVTLIHKYKEFKADPITVQKTLAHANFKALAGFEPVEVKGNPFVTGLVISDVDTGAQQELPVTGVFVEIGVMPNTGFAKGIVALDEYGRVKADPRNQQAYAPDGSIQPGVWAAGDCTDELYHQNNIAAGDAVKALEDIYYWIKKN